MCMVRPCIYWRIQQGVYKRNHSITLTETSVLSPGDRAPPLKPFLLKTAGHLTWFRSLLSTVFRLQSASLTYRKGTKTDTACVSET